MIKRTSQMKVALSVKLACGLSSLRDPAKPTTAIVATPSREYAEVAVNRVGAALLSSIFEVKDNGHATRCCVYRNYAFTTHYGYKLATFTKTSLLPIRINKMIPQH